jgi:molybdenum cofactor guanylyltransferase
VAGLRAVAPARRVAVVAVDLPGVSGDVLAHLAERIGAADAAVPAVAGRLQPLHAVLAASCAPVLEDALVAGERRVLAVLERLSVVVVDEAELRAAGLTAAFARDVDTPDDLASWRVGRSGAPGRPGRSGLGEREDPDGRPGG